MVQAIHSQLATLSSPLYCHDSYYDVTDNHKKAFDGIQNALTSSLFLCYLIYDGKAQFVIQTNASTTVIRTPGLIFYPKKMNVKSCQSPVPRNWPLRSSTHNFGPPAGYWILTLWIPTFGPPAEYWIPTLLDTDPTKKLQQ
uniref:Uncharacterized protein n=1 Tax=Romanomermis culicivorax TaxID=13658 RepID=A0A915JU79_ROMCU